MALFYVPLLVLFAVASEGTHITFPSLAEDNLMTFGDAAYNHANRSFIINTGDSPSRGSCGALVYARKVRIQDAATGRAASFSTTFSFAVNSTTTVGTPSRDDHSSPRDGSAFTIAFLKSIYFPTTGDFTSGSELGQSGRCKSYRPALNTSLMPISFDVTFGTEYEPNHNMTSSQYIRVGKNDEDAYNVSAYTHNLCGSETDCDYFSKVGLFTAWIDFNSSSHTLEVRLASGFNSSVTTKPLQPLLLIPHYEVPKGIGDDVYITFWGVSDVHHVEAHELLSWSFFSSAGSESYISSTRSSLVHVLKAGIPIGVLEAVALLVIFWAIFRYARSSKYSAYPLLQCAAGGPYEYSYAELQKATGNFDDRNLLGTGGSGSVYKGTMECPRGKKIIAVKQISFSEVNQAASVLHAEVATLGQIRHRNVVTLFGWCQETGRMSLIYEYKPNGGLNEWLHKNGSHFHCQALCLKLRQSILEGVGAALEYLHEDCQTCILHRDIKSSNVLLDEDFKAYLGDFGLACLMDDHKLDKSTSAVGTLGYMAPEVPYTGKATKESDVYSFGILVLEVVSGRHPIDMQSVDPEDLVLLDSVWRAHEAGALPSVVDPRLLQTLEPSRSISLQTDESMNTMTTISRVVDVAIEVQKSMIVNLLHLGLLCCLPNPKARPSMSQVNGILQRIRDMENVCTITTVTMPSLPVTKPPGLYRSLEFSRVALSIDSSTAHCVSAGHTKSLVNNSAAQQSFDNFHKDE